jgi:hypothetical protein
VVTGRSLPTFRKQIPGLKAMTGSYSVWFTFTLGLRGKKPFRAAPSAGRPIEKPLTIQLAPRGLSGRLRSEAHSGLLPVSEPTVGLRTTLGVNNRWR